MHPLSWFVLAAGLVSVALVVVPNVIERRHAIAEYWRDVAWFATHPRGNGYCTLRDVIVPWWILRVGCRVLRRCNDSCRGRQACGDRMVRRG